MSSSSAARPAPKGPARLRGTQPLSAGLATSEEQRQVAQDTIANVDASGPVAGKAVT